MPSFDPNKVTPEQILFEQQLMAQWRQHAESVENEQTPETPRRQVDTGSAKHARSTGNSTGPVSRSDLVVATRQLATLLAAGMPLVPSLQALAEQLAGRPLGKVIAGLKEQVNSGDSLAAALRTEPHVFPPLYAGMVQAGEASGTLETILEKLAELMEKRARLVRKLRATLTYPVVMLIAAVGVILFLLTYAVPSLAKLFDDMNQQLPGPTLALINVSRFLQHNIALIAMLAVLAVGGAIAWLRQPKGRLFGDRLRLRLPLLGPIILKAEVARMAHTLGILLGGGVPLLKSLSIVVSIAQNRVLADALNEAQTNIEKGATIADALRDSKVFPPIVHHMVATGEMSGQLEQALVRIADMYDEEVEASSRSLTSLLEPLVLVAMGVVVGFIVLAMLLPIFEINQAL